MPTPEHVTHCCCSCRCFLEMVSSLVLHRNLSIVYPDMPSHLASLLLPLRPLLVAALTHVLLSVHAITSPLIILLSPAWLLTCVWFFLAPF